MQYYKAFKKKPDEPYLTFQLWANSLQELEALGEDDNPLIVREDQLPEVEYGVYLKKINESGELVDFTAPEIVAIRDAYNIKVGLNSEAQRIGEINTGSFTYDGKEFPMDEVSRLFYLALEKRQPSSSKIRTMDNTAYTLTDTNINDFLAEYYKELLLLSKHTI